MGSSSANLPAELIRRFDVVVKPSAKQRSLRLREVSADHIGRLVVLQVSSHARACTTSPEACVVACLIDLCYNTQVLLLKPVQEAVGLLRRSSEASQWACTGDSDASDRREAAAHCCDVPGPESGH